MCHTQERKVLKGNKEKDSKKDKRTASDSRREQSNRPDSRAKAPAQHRRVRQYGGSVVSVVTYPKAPTVLPGMISAPSARTLDTGLEPFTVTIQFSDADGTYLCLITGKLDLGSKCTIPP